MKEKVKIKAWAVIVYDGFISTFIDEKHIHGRAVFFDEFEARKCLDTFVDKETKELVQHARVVPIQIIYSLPKKN